MNLLVNDKEMLKKYSEIWDKIQNLFGKKFDSEPVYNDEHIKAKINSSATNSHGNKTPIEGEHYTCFSVILLDSIVNVDKKYHPQIFLKECKYAVKMKKIMNTINEELKLDELMMMNMMMNMIILLNAKLYVLNCFLIIIIDLIMCAIFYLYIIKSIIFTYILNQHR